MTIRDRFKRSIQRLFLGDLVIDPEECIKKMVDVLKKKEYQLPLSRKKSFDSYWFLVKSYLKIRKFH